MKRKIFCTVFLILGVLLGAEEEARLLRFPTIHEDEIAFTYAGDLYSVPAKGGVARRLTCHEGYEMFARFSPDGRHIAFTGQYDGNTEVYLIPAQGGGPKRLTYTASLDRDYVWDRMGPNNIVIGWKNSEEIVFRTRMHTFDPFIGELYLVRLTGGLPEQIPLPRGGFCSYSPDEKKLAYNRVFREFRTWKRYRGGMADDIWIHDFETAKTENITSHSAQDIIPLWHENRIYFLSDRERVMNLYVYDLNTHETKRVTDFQDFDIKFPSLGRNAIVFENGGFIYRYDLSDGRCERVPIFIEEDMPGGREKIVNVSQYIADVSLAPDGKRALFGARGEIFTVPAKYGNIRNLTASSGIHEREAVWSPDGKWIAFISDASGEDEIYLMPADQSAPHHAVTLGGDTYKYEIAWSPDSSKILWSDKKLRLRYVEIENSKIHEVDQATVWEIRDYAWSPDSKWICYARPEPAWMSKICLYSLEQNKTYDVTDAWYRCYSPTFSRDGKYLFFVSSCDFNPRFCNLEWNYFFTDMDRIYLITLACDTMSPFYPKSDEVAVQGKAKDGGEGAKEAPALIRVDTGGITQRIADIPVSPSSYWSLDSVGNRLYYMRKNSLCMYDLDALAETVIAEADGYAVSADGAKMLVSKGGSYYLTDLPSGALELNESLDLSRMEMKLNRHEEWEQIFNECWRQMRDFFYVPNMHGIDWNAMREKYRPLVKHVNHRADLTYIIGEMIGELNCGHTYIGEGDMPQIQKIPVGLLGAELERDGSGYYRVKRILKGQNWRSNLRSPLTEIGVGVHEGEYILSVNGKATNSMANIYESLVNTPGTQVTLEINEKPGTEGSRKVVVRPIRDEVPLYYYNWVEENIRKVSNATGGEVGYIHLPDMGEEGLTEFAKYFYPQLRKKALIVDVRSNGGGFVSGMVIERLRREIALVEVARNTAPLPDPWAAVYGPKVCLANEFSASDGDLFAYRFKRYGLGKVIGKRTWGGVVGIRDTLPLLDGGYLYKPEFACYDPSGAGWIVEGHGVDPDIVVDNDPAREYRGIDDQLNKAIEVILEELKKYEQTLPPIPEYPQDK